MLFETKVCNSATLLFLCGLADKHEFNRRAKTDELAQAIDPEGINVLQLMMEYHRASFGPSVDPVWPDHHRCLVFCKVQDSDEPAEFFLDVEVSRYNELLSANELEEMLKDPVSVGIANARAYSDEEEDDA